MRELIQSASDGGGGDVERKRRGVCVVCAGGKEMSQDNVDLIAPQVEDLTSPYASRHLQGFKSSGIFNDYDMILLVTSHRISSIINS